MFIYKINIKTSGSQDWNLIDLKIYQISNKLNMITFLSNLQYQKIVKKLYQDQKVNKKSLKWTLQSIIIKIKTHKLKSKNKMYP